MDLLKIGLFAFFIAITSAAQAIQTSRSFDTPEGALLAVQASAALLGRVMQFSDELDQQISSSAAACFNTGFTPQVPSPLASYFLTGAMLGEQFHAKNCPQISGKRFYAQHEEAEFFIFAINMQQARVEGAMEFCTDCEGTQLRTHLRYRDENLSFRLGENAQQPLLLQEKAGMRYLTGQYAFVLNALPECQFALQQITTINALFFQDEALTQWNIEKSTLPVMQQGELSVIFDSGAHYQIRYMDQAVWVNEQRIAWQKYHALKNQCGL